MSPQKKADCIPRPLRGSGQLVPLEAGRLVHDEGGDVVLVFGPGVLDFFHVPGVGFTAGDQVPLACDPVRDGGAGAAVAFRHYPGAIRVALIPVLEVLDVLDTTDDP